MSTLSDSTKITPGQGSFTSLNITVNSILPAGNEGFLLCVPNHSAPIFSLFEVLTIRSPGVHLTLRLMEFEKLDCQSYGSKWIEPKGKKKKKENIKSIKVKENLLD